ncbi:thioredoxin family protein [uncultured Mesonia sp.]|uniref:thioredoxin family protein n=1 Tax=uncultured Mesonia sp. TaxID=399731 RepID=UPI00374F541D
MRLVDIKQKIDFGQPLLLYFSGKQCSVCHSLKPKIRAAVTENFPKMEFLEIAAEMHPEIAAHFQVFQVPCLLVFFNQKEYIRKGGNVSVHVFINEVERLYTLYEQMKSD